MYASKKREYCTTSVTKTKPTCPGAQLQNVRGGRGVSQSTFVQLQFVSVALVEKLVPDLIDDVGAFVVWFE